MRILTLCMFLATQGLLAQSKQKSRQPKIRPLNLMPISTGWSCFLGAVKGYGKFEKYTGRSIRLLLASNSTMTAEG